MWSRAIPLFAVLTLVGCASSAIPGTYEYGGWPRAESLVLSPDRTFAYHSWSDDGGVVCRASGYWREGAADGTVVTVTQSHEPGDAEACPWIAIEQTWRLNGSTLCKDQHAEVSVSGVDPCSRRKKAPQTRLSTGPGSTKKAGNQPSGVWRRSKYNTAPGRLAGAWRLTRRSGRLGKRWHSGGIRETSSGRLRSG